MIRRIHLSSFPIAAVNGAPSGNVGNHLAQSIGFIPLVDADFFLQIRLGGAAAATLTASAFVWGQRLAQWAPLGNSAGQLNGGAAITGVANAAGFYFFSTPLVNLSMIDRFYLQMASFTGVNSVDANLFIGRNPTPQAV